MPIPHNPTSLPTDPDEPHGTPSKRAVDGALSVTPSSTPTAPRGPAGTVNPLAGPRDLPTTLLKVRANFPFIYVHFPGSFHVVDVEMPPDPFPKNSTFLLPRLIMYRMQPGLVGFASPRKNSRDARESYKHAFDRIEQMAGRVIDPGQHGYVKAFPCIDPRTRIEGTHYTEVWNTPRPYRPGKTQRWDFDRQTFYNWLISLVMEGEVHEPEVEDIRSIVSKAEKRVQRVEAFPEGHPNLERFRNDLARVKKMIWANSETAKSFREVDGGENANS